MEGKEMGWAVSSAGRILDEEDKQGQAPGRRGFIRVAEKRGRRLFFSGLWILFLCLLSYEMISSFCLSC